MDLDLNPDSENGCDTDTDLQHGKTNTNARRECEASVENIKLAFHSTKNTDTKPIEKQLEEVKEQIGKGTKIEHIELTTSVLMTIGPNISRLQSGDPMIMASALFDILSKAAYLTPFSGPLVGKIFGLLSQLFGSFSSTKKNDMSDMVQGIVDRTLAQYEDKALRRDAVGVRRDFSSPNAFLSGMVEGNDISQHDITAMLSSVPIYKGIAFLGILAAKLDENTKVKGRHEKLMAYTKMYCELGFLRYLMLYQMYAVAKSSGHSENIAKSIMRVIESDKEETKSSLKFLTTPNRENAAFFVQVNLFDTKWKTIQEFLYFVGLELQDLSYLSNGKYSISSEEYREWFLYINYMNSVQACEEPGESGEFVFQETEEKNVFSISSHRWPLYKMFMQQSPFQGVRFSIYEQDGAEKWKIIRLSDDGTYMLSPLKWQGLFMFMRKPPAILAVSAMIKPPLKQGYWKIEKIEEKADTTEKEMILTNVHDAVTDEIKKVENADTEKGTVLTEIQGAVNNGVEKIKVSGTTNTNTILTDVHGAVTEETEQNVKRPHNKGNDFPYKCVL